MRKHKALGVNALPDEIVAVDKRREELGLSRAKYLITLAKLDIEHQLLVAETTGDGRAIINLVEPRKPVVRIEKSEMIAWGEQIIEKFFRRLAVQVPSYQGVSTPMVSKKLSE